MQVYIPVYIKEILQDADMLSSPHVRTLRQKKKKKGSKGNSLGFLCSRRKNMPAIYLTFQFNKKRKHFTLSMLTYKFNFMGV